MGIKYKNEWQKYDWGVRLVFENKYMHLYPTQNYFKIPSNMWFSLISARKLMRTDTVYRNIKIK